MADTIKKDARRSFSNTVSAGLKSLGGKGKTFYVLEFKNNSQMHKAKTTKEIIVDYIELGRSPKCQIRFGEDCRTVSGVHCAIMREGEHYFVKHLSKVNPTLINGKPVADKFYINSGDEITLSYGGPIVGFIVPNDNRTSTIPLTRRLSLFREQAMRPYKRAIAMLSFLMILMIVGFIYYENVKEKEREKKDQEFMMSIKKQDDTIGKQDSTIAAQSTLISSQKKQIEQIKHQFKNYFTQKKSDTIFDSGIQGGKIAPTDITQIYPSIYYIKCVQVEITYSGVKKQRAGNWSGTGFLLSDGRFVTARHVIESWNYLSPDDDDASWIENMVESNNGEVVATFIAESSSGQILKFKSNEFKVNRLSDEKLIKKTDDGESFYVTKGSPLNDWAVLNTNQKGNLVYNSTLSNSLAVGTQLFTLGFPLGQGAVDRPKLEPMFNTLSVASSGVANGFINTSNDGSNHGNSGGPLLVKVNDMYYVVGIVSRVITGASGLAVPISRIN
jgi:S1-C subfamily serine protease